MVSVQTSVQLPACRRRPASGLKRIAGQAAALAVLLGLLITGAMPAAASADSLPAAEALPVATTSASPDQPSPVALSRLEAGGRLFEAHCVGCHVNGGNVIRRGRTLKLAALERAGLADPEAIARIAAGGIGQMSGYGSVLGEEGSRQVADWVWLQARAGWPRPARLEPLP